MKKYNKKTNSNVAQTVCILGFLFLVFLHADNHASQTHKQVYEHELVCEHKLACEQKQVYEQKQVCEIVSGSNARIEFALIGSSAEHNMNYLDIKVNNKSDEPRILVLNLQNRPGLWYGGYGTQFCLVLMENEKKQVSLPVSHDFFKLKRGGRMNLSVYEAESAFMTRFPNLERSRQLFYGDYFPDWSFCYTFCDLEHIDVLFSGHFCPGDIFTVLWKPETTFNIYTSDQMDVYVHKESVANKVIGQIIARRESALDTLSVLLDVSMQDRLRLVFYPDCPTKTFDTGHTGMGFAFRNNVVEIYNEQEQLADYHEIAHVLIRLIGNPPAMFNEGFATYADEMMGAAAISSFGYGSMLIDEAARTLVEEDRLIPVEELFAYTEIGSPESNPPVAYVQSASFTKYLVEHFGYNAFRKILAELENSQSEEVIAHNKARFTEIIGIDLARLYALWKRSVALPKQ